MNRLGMVLAALVALAVVGCGGPRVAVPKAADGNKLAVAVYTDRGIDQSLTGDQVRQRNQLGDWMERDLVNQLNRAGYQARLVQKPSDFTPAAGSYLLKVKVVRYNPGSKAARMVVGFGAGATSLDNRYELSAGKGEPLLAWDDGIGSSLDWTNCARKLNQQTVQAVTKTLNKM